MESWGIIVSLESHSVSLLLLYHLRLNAGIPDGLSDIPPLSFWGDERLTLKHPFHLWLRSHLPATQTLQLLIHSRAHISKNQTLEYSMGTGSWQTVCEQALVSLLSAFIHP